MKIYITGFMGSGKSTYGQALAEALGYKFIDLDAMIEKREGSTIQALFKDKGEDYFRKREHEALLETAGAENTVIATGGGAPCFFDNMNWMNEQGLTVYLKLFESELKKRIEQLMSQRPLLENISAEDLDAWIYKTLRERAFYYHQSKIVIDATSIEAEDLAEILRGQDNL